MKRFRPGSLDTRSRYPGQHKMHRSLPETSCWHMKNLSNANFQYIFMSNTYRKLKSPFSKDKCNDLILDIIECMKIHMLLKHCCLFIVIFHFQFFLFLTKELKQALRADTKVLGSTATSEHGRFCRKLLFGIQYDRLPIRSMPALDCSV